MNTAGMRRRLRAARDRGGIDPKRISSSHDVKIYLDIVPHAVIVVQADGICSYWNPSALTLHGFSGEKEAKSLTVFELARTFELEDEAGCVVPPGRWPLARLVCGEDVGPVVYTCRRIGSDRHFVASHSGRFSRDGGFGVLTIHDLTASRAQEQAVAEACGDVELRAKRAEAAAQVMGRYADRLEAANHELRAFTYSVAHDLRAPLRNIGRHLDKLEGWLEDRRDAQPWTQAIRDRCERAQRLCDHLLTLERNRDQEFDLQTVDVGQVVRAVWEDVQADCEDRPVSFTVGSLPEACGDPLMLHQAFANLIGNAAKFTRDREPAVIEVGAEAMTDETVYYVRDNGVGFPTADAERLFHPFERSGRATECEGHGVGLAIVAQVAARHRGRVWAQSTVEGGATFYLALPNVRTTG